MISVLLTLLKILGIILLSLIGLFIVLLLIVLFVPVRYRFKGYYKDEFVCHGKVTWLLHLVSVSIDYEKELITKIKILGISLEAFKRKQKAVKQDEKELPADTNAKTDNNTKADSVTKTTDSAPKSVSKSEAELIESSSIETSIEDTQPEDNKEASTKLSWFQKIKCTILNVLHKIRDIINKIRNIISNIRQKKETIQQYIEIIKREEVKQAFSVCKRRIWLLIKHILPKKMNVTIDFGFDDPSTTGYILAVYGMLPAAFGKKIILHPDFENSLFTCDFSLKGAVNAWSILHQLLCILTDRNCRALYHIVKKEILNERK